MALPPQARRLRFGIAGMSSDHVWGMGDGLAALPEVELVAGAEPYPELRQRATAQWGLARTYESFTTMLDQEELDAVLVCTDNASKAEVAEAAGPLAGCTCTRTSPWPPRWPRPSASCAPPRSPGSPSWWPTTPPSARSTTRPKALIQAGAIGRVYLARGVTGHGGPREFGCSEYFCEWLFDAHRNGGGAFVDEACYLLDAFVDYLGPVVEVSAFTAPIGHRDYLPPGVEDNAVAILRFASGALGVIDAKWGQVGPAPLRTSYHGVQGTLISGPAGTDLYSTAAPPSLRTGPRWRCLRGGVVRVVGPCGAIGARDRLAGRGGRPPRACGRGGPERGERRDRAGGGGSSAPSWTASSAGARSKGPPVRAWRGMSRR